MSDISLKIIAGTDLADRLAGAAVEARAAIRREVNAASLLLASTMRANVKSALRMRSGDLYESITPIPVEESGAEISGGAGSNMEYAEIQERGGTITAKDTLLTIPLDAMLTGRGIARGTAHEVIDNPGRFGFDGTFFSRGVLMGRRGEGADAEVEPLFALRRSVTIPAHPYAQPALDQTATTFEAAITVALEALL
jgi:hypothetical protein